MALSFTTHTLFLLFLVLLIIPLSSGMVEGFSRGRNPSPSLHKMGKDGMKSGKVMMDMVLDYEDAGPNVKHDPRKKGGKP